MADEPSGMRRPDGPSAMPRNAEAGLDAERMDIEFRRLVQESFNTMAVIKSTRPVRA